jgi:tetratricopeptide (TPR) repeat protein
MKIMSMLRVAVVWFAPCLAAGFTAGCHELIGVEISNCAKPATAGSQPLQTPELVEHGNAYLHGALRDLVRSGAVDVQSALRQAADCYGRALRLSPDSYEAQLSMSVTYLARARLEDPDSADRVSLLASARRMLGRAYMLRHGAYEPLYYLAQVAIEDGKLDLARQLLEVLQAARFKDGPVNTLLGHLHERLGHKREAAAFYAQAMAAGWPAESLLWAARRFRHIDGSELIMSQPAAEGR